MASRLPSDWRFQLCSSCGFASSLVAGLTRTCQRRTQPAMHHSVACVRVMGKGSKNFCMADSYFSSLLHLLAAACSHSVSYKRGKAPLRSVFVSALSMNLQLQHCCIVLSFIKHEI